MHRRFSGAVGSQDYGEKMKRLVRRDRNHNSDNNSREPDVNLDDDLEVDSADGNVEPQGVQIGSSSQSESEGETSSDEDEDVDIDPRRRRRKMHLSEAVRSRGHSRRARGKSKKSSNRNKKV